MNPHEEQLQALSDIRSMMERSSRFISLSGLSGVFAGTFALIGAWAAYHSLQTASYTQGEFYTFFFLDAGLVLLASFATGILLTIRNAKKKGQSIWDATVKRLLINLLIPLAAGGLFCLALLNQGIIEMIAPATLIFYGLALINASKYTLSDVRYLGFAEILLGLIAAFFLHAGLLFWALGFGLLHIVYGIGMYYRYER